MNGLSLLFTAGLTALGTQLTVLPTAYNGQQPAFVGVDPSKAPPGNLVLEVDDTSSLPSAAPIDSITVQDNSHGYVLNGGPTPSSPFTDAGVLPSTSALWGVEATVAYFSQNFGRNGLNNALPHVQLTVMSNYCSPTTCGNNEWTRAEWNGQYLLANAAYLLLGGGDNVIYGNQVAVDTVAHALVKGIEQYEVNGGQGFVPTGESGAIAEGFADLFGQAVKTAKGGLLPGSLPLAPAHPWVLGDDDLLDPTLRRDMQNPQGNGHPDAYQGPGYAFDTTTASALKNSTVLSHWFYLLEQGGAGTNSLGKAYSVIPIGKANAEKLAYWTLTSGLPSTLTFAQLRSAFIAAAVAHFGKDSQFEVSVTDAWAAVGVGDPYLDTLAVTPTDGSTQAPHVVLTWKARNNSSYVTPSLENSWVVEIDSSPAFNPATTQKFNVAGTPSLAVDLALGQTFYWRVTGSWSIAQDPAYSGLGSPRAVHFFTTALSSPTFLHPVGSEAQAFTVLSGTIEWTPVPGAGQYQIHISTSPTFSTNTILMQWTTSTSLQTAPLTPNTTYYARVRATSPASATTAWSTTWTSTQFTTGANPSIILSKTYNGQSTSPWALEMYWWPVPGASKYIVELGRSMLNWPEQSHTVMAGGLTQYVQLFTKPVDKTIWYYRIRAIGSDGVTEAYPSPLDSAKLDYARTVVTVTTSGLPADPLWPTMLIPSGTGASTWSFSVNRVPGAVRYEALYYKVGYSSQNVPQATTYLDSQVLAVDGYPDIPGWTTSPVAKLVPPAVRQLAASPSKQVTDWGAFYTIRAVGPGNDYGYGTPFKGILALPDAPSVKMAPGINFYNIGFFESPLMGTSQWVDQKLYFTAVGNPNPCGTLYEATHGKLDIFAWNSTKQLYDIAASDIGVWDPTTSKWWYSDPPYVSTGDDGQWWQQIRVWIDSRLYAQAPSSLAAKTWSQCVDQENVRTFWTGEDIFDWCGTTGCVSQ